MPILDLPTPAPIGTLSAVGKISIILLDDEGVQTMIARIEIENAAGEILRSFDGSLTPYLTEGQINQLQNVLDAVREKAAADML